MGEVNIIMREKKKQKNRKIKKYDISKNSQINKNMIYTKEELIEIQCEAYYQALRRMQEEKEKVIEEKSSSFKWWENVLFFLNLMLFPWHINKKFKIKGKFADGILTMAVSFSLKVIGFLAWLVASVWIGMGIYSILSHNVLISQLLIEILYSLLFFLFGGMFTLAGKEVSMETDSQKVYAYSASFMAVISVVIALIMLFRG